MEKKHQKLIHMPSEMVQLNSLKCLPALLRGLQGHPSGQPFSTARAVLRRSGPPLLQVPQLREELGGGPGRARRGGSISRVFMAGDKRWMAVIGR